MENQGIYCWSLFKWRLNRIFSLIIHLTIWILLWGSVGVYLAATTLVLSGQQTAASCTRTEPFTCTFHELENRQITCVLIMGCRTLTGHHYIYQLPDEAEAVWDWAPNKADRCDQKSKNKWRQPNKNGEMEKNLLWKLAMDRSPERHANEKAHRWKSIIMQEAENHD